MPPQPTSGLVPRIAPRRTDFRTRVPYPSTTVGGSRGGSGLFSWVSGWYITACYETQHHWENGVGWISDRPPRTCRTCGTSIPENGRGGPFRYCPDHAPADRAAEAKWYQAHRDRIRDYNRRRDGAHELKAGICADCGNSYRTRIGSPVCSLCRAIAKNAAISRQNQLARLGLAR